MSGIQLGIYPLSYREMTDRRFLDAHIYPDMRRNYYWSEDFSPEYYIAQAKAGFIAVTDRFEGRELLLPEIQFSYAVLHFKDLHISRNVKRILKRRDPKLKISTDIDTVAEKIRAYHRNCWLTPRYQSMLKATRTINENFQLIAAFIEEGRDRIYHRKYLYQPQRLQFKDKVLSGLWNNTACTAWALSSGERFCILEHGSDLYAL